MIKSEQIKLELQAKFSQVNQPLKPCYKRQNDLGTGRGDGCTFRPIICRWIRMIKRKIFHEGTHAIRGAEHHENRGPFT
jgi:hypothetical protein